MIRKVVQGNNTNPTDTYVDVLWSGSGGSGRNKARATLVHWVYLFGQIHCHKHVDIYTHINRSGYL